MFIIERVTGYTFTKDGLHEPYRGEKTHHAVASETLRSLGAVAVDKLESSCSSSHRKKKSKLSRFLKAILGTCSYAATTVYEAHLEVRELRQHQGLPPLEPPRAPPE